jgi:hypothetical protein
MTEASNPAELRARAARYRLMVKLTTDARLIKALLQLADEYEATADWLEDNDYDEGGRNLSADDEER